MKKYSEIKSITRDYLNGELFKLTMEYTDDKNLKVSIVYEDSYDYLFDYDIEVHSKTHDFNFLGHQSKSAMFKLKLERDKQFEQAICNSIFQNA